MTPNNNMLRARREKKLGRSAIGMCHTSAMAYWPAWLTP